MAAEAPGISEQPKDVNICASLKTESAMSIRRERLRRGVKPQPDIGAADPIFCNLIRNLQEVEARRRNNYRDWQGDAVICAEYDDRDYEPWLFKLLMEYLTTGEMDGYGG
jgi:hypothetical protein